MIYMIVILLMVKYRHDIAALMPRLEPDPLELYGGLDYEPTIEQDKRLRRVK